ncbi:MAG: class I SAM-dependent methyltransferase [Alphaproteobacteria bacterium]|nr:class I SAM-dependent methyltransferase [Alphaproteobacteria bacterium]
MTGRESWQSYYAKTGARPPRATLLFALDRFDAEPAPAGRPRFAVDLGSGNGRDTVEILRRDWRVLAIDAEAAALEGLRARPDLPPGAGLETQCAPFAAATWPACDLVNASFALPLTPPATFPAVWARIVAALEPGGRFAGQLYGPRDSWFGDPTITFHDRAEVDALVRPFVVEHWREEEDDSTTPRGRPKHWHIFHIVARRR